jgi:N-acyl-D-amino-acid deacylase
MSRLNRAAICLFAFAAGCSTQPDFDLIIRGGTVYDGTGELPGVRRADVGITGDRIRAIGDLSARRAPVVIEANGKAVAPGFIDAQSRSGLTLLADGSGENHLRQGITSEILADGSPALWSAATADPVALQRYNLTLDWSGLGGYFTKVESRGTAINVGTLVPLSVARTAGDRNAFIDAAMRDGAFGIVDDVHADGQEVSAAAAIAGRYGGVVMVHADSEVAATDDAIVAVGSQARRLIIADLSHAPASHPASEMITRILRVIARMTYVLGTMTPYPPAPGEPDTAVRETMKFGGTMIVTDSGTMKDSTAAAGVHPAAFGAFPRLFALVRDAHLIELREAVRRATSTPATLYQIQERGFVRENYFADLVVFDPQTISDRATFEKPNQYAVGIEYVIVNGVVELTPRGLTGSRAGSRLLRRPASR